MAQGIRLVCSNCNHSLEAWDDGNPFYLDSNGKKKYAYHPSPERDLCIGNDIPNLCLDSEIAFKVDSRHPVNKAPCCGSVKFVDTFSLANQACPKCKVGKFGIDPGFGPVS